MNAGIESGHPSLHYYDGDYPSAYFSVYPENFDETTKLQGLAHDVPRYLEIARQQGGAVLELCCGTGRVAIPIALQGLSVTAVDLSSELLDQFRANLARQPKAAIRDIQLIEQDITKLSLDRRDYATAIIAFNSLLCIPSFEGQMKALQAIASHLAPNGLLVLDIVNPLKLKIDGDPVAKPFFTRRNPHNGNTYTRFAMADAFDENQLQRLHGWYDEIDSQGRLKRSHYSVHWRPIFRFEIELMLRAAGFELECIEGGHQKEAFTAQSPRMLIQARKR